MNNRKVYASRVPGVDHLPHTLDIEHNAFSRGLPPWGAHLANELERLIGLHDDSTIAAVIVEPIAGSAGVHIAARGILKPPARDLRQERHLADFRQSHHRLRPRRQSLRLAGFRCDARTS